MNVMPPSLSVACLRWAALNDAAAVVAGLAGLEAADDRDCGPLPDMLRASEGWRRTMAEHGIADMAAVMEPGLAALLAVNARGADPRPAAESLWLEYSAARQAILALLRPADEA